MAGNFLHIAGLTPGSSWLDLRTRSVLQQYALLLPVLALASTPVPAQLMARLQKRQRLFAAVQAAGVLLSGVLCLILLVGQSYNPFLYFRF